MSTSDKSQTGLNILCIDGGGVRGLSALVLLEEVMHRIQHLEGLDSPLEPYKYFDLIAGSGTGAIQACMLGRLKMPVRSAIESYETIAKEVFSDRKWAGSESFKITRLKHSLRKLVQRATGDPDSPMQESSLDSQCKTLVYAMSSHTIRGNIPIAFRSYPAGALEGPRCTVWEALCATMAHPTLFKCFEIDGPPKWSFIGADLGCNNPLVYVLAEVKTAYINRHVAAVLSLGTGHSDTIPTFKTYGIRQTLPAAAIIAMRSIAANTERVEEEIARRFSSTQNTYFRLNVDRGIQSVGITKWEQLSEVAGHTRAYMRLATISQVIDQAAKAVRTRSLHVPSEQIDGTIQISGSRQVLVNTDGSCPDPTPAYTGREDMIEVTESCILGRSTIERIICVVYGLGGAGKTQLALKVVERTRNHWANVIYIDASTRDSIEDGLRGVSVARKIGDSYKDALRWLESHQEPWLLVFDNADDEDIRLHDYFPSGNHGSIIITTRLYGMTALAQGLNSICSVSSLSPGDALVLLLKTARKQETVLSSEEIESAKAIVEDVGQFALAIVHAGAFIGQSQHMTFASYRSMFRDRKRQALEAYSKLPAAVKVDNYGHTVYTTWVMCYEKLGSEAQVLLWLIAYMHHSSITIDIFRRAAAKIGSYKPELPTTALEDSALDHVRRFLRSFIDSSGSWDDLAFTKVVNEISSHSLLEYDHTLQSYRIHVLVQGWAGTVVPHAAKLAVQNTRTMLSMAIPHDNNIGSISFRHSVGLHVEKVHLEPVGEGALSHAEAFSRVFSERGQEAKVEPLLKQVCELSKSVQGDKHPNTLARMSNLALTYSNVGQLEEARALQIQVVDTLKEVQGDRHPDTLTSMNNLAATYSDLGQPAEAQKLEVQVLDARKQVLGDKHPDTLTSMNNLAATYRSLGKPEEARALLAQVLDALTQVLGDKHPDTLTSMNNLAATYSDLGHLEEARTLEVQVLYARKQVLGDRHPDTLTSMYNLAGTYRDLGQREAARALEVQVLDARKQVLGNKHPDTLRSMKNLAGTYRSLGKRDEARALLVQVLDARKQVLGDGHPDTLRCMHNLAYIHFTLGQYDQAQALFAQSFSGLKNELGISHRYTLRCMCMLAKTYLKLGLWDEADKLQIKLEVYSQVFGESHRATKDVQRVYKDIQRYRVEKGEGSSQG